ncbi:hypothetical protein E3J62_08510 [candidate division TA06 bacterium]|uniref:Glycosyltransferase RgtA/B/C/D-like domain-containing protein n=1 Tax=candidate division TA06 bacterium TaxID=2250710 RepID=A0A523US83_UNCT6|nr:MAG: hypothetical protein E3J62_08510 [candidate division TA06 bacterium]
MLRFLLSAGCAALAGTLLIHYLRWSPEKMVAHFFFSDDAFFYSVLARNFHEFGFLTLDGEMSTNGVQPLWMFVQIVLAKLFPNVDGVTLISASSWVCYVALAFAATWFVARGAPYTMCLSALIVAGLTLLNVRFQSFVVNGLETPLTILVVLLTLFMIDRVARNPSKSSPRQLTLAITGLAIFSSLCFFARTDLFWIPLAVGGWLAVARGDLRRKWIPYSIIVLILVLPYLLSNYIGQGSLMPISGRVKLFYLTSFYPDLQSYLHSREWQGLFIAFARFLPLLERLSVFVSLTFAAAALTISQVVVWRDRSEPPIPFSLKILAAAIVGHILFMQFVYRELRPYTAYYFVLEMLWVTMVLAFWAKRTHSSDAQKTLFRSLRKYAGTAIALISVAVAVAHAVRADRRPSSYWVERMNLAGDIRRIVPENERIAAFWPGCFAQFSGRFVTALDGVIGSNDYFQSYVSKNKELDYILERSRPWLAIYLPRSPDLLLGETPPEVDEWADTYITRLWERRHTIEIEILASRLLNREGGGWYLLRLSETHRRDGAP